MGDLKTVHRRKEIRDTILERLYDITGGQPNHWVDLEDLVTKEAICDEEELHAAYHYLMQKREIKPMGSGYRVSITEAGVDYVEAKIKTREEQRYRLIRRIYEGVGGSTQNTFEPDDLAAWGQEIGLTRRDAETGFEYFAQEQLVDRREDGALGLTQKGLAEVVKSLREPDEGTDHFHPTVINHVTNIYGPVGSLQQGSHNTAHVAQQINAPPAQIAEALAALREAASQLPTEAREETEEAIDMMEEEAKAETPKRSRVALYARTLNTHLVTFGPVIATVMRLILGGG